MTTAIALQVVLGALFLTAYLVGMVWVLRAIDRYFFGGGFEDSLDAAERDE